MNGAPWTLSGLSLQKDGHHNKGLVMDLTRYREVFA